MTASALQPGGGDTVLPLMRLCAALTLSVAALLAPASLRAQSVEVLDALRTRALELDLSGQWVRAESLLLGDQTHGLVAHQAADHHACEHTGDGD